MLVSSESGSIPVITPGAITVLGTWGSEEGNDVTNASHEHVSHNIEHERILVLRFRYKHYQWDALNMATVNFNESITSTPATDEAVISELRDRLTEATIKCSERCLYQSAKW